MFCPRCGTILKVKKLGKRNVMFCRCGYVLKDLNAKTKITEQIVKPEERLGIAEKGTSHLPKTIMLCPKCSHTSAFFWSLQTRGADEAETRFFKCEKCGHTWREYD